MALQKYAAVYCITVKENAALEKESITVQPVLGSMQSKLRYINPGLYFSIKNYCKQNGIKHIIIEHPYYGWLGYLLKKFAGLRYIIRSHNIEGERFRSLKKWWWRIMFGYEKMVHRYADLNFFITEEDKTQAIAHFKLDEKKCFVSPYGIEGLYPANEKKLAAKQQVMTWLGIAAQPKLLLFNGALDYAPNRDALDKILYQINPLLKATLHQPYKIIICGKGLDAKYDGLKDFLKDDIIYAGFVPDIELYFLAADVFINPITSGGGIKTKLVEALAANTPAVSFKAGAQGVPTAVTGNSLYVVSDNDYTAFANAIVNVVNNAPTKIPQAFYNYFSWDAIAKNAVDRIYLNN